jgi:hypothetical protein
MFSARRGWPTRRPAFLSDRPSGVFQTVQPFQNGQHSLTVGGAPPSEPCREAGGAVSWLFGVEVSGKGGVPSVAFFEGKTEPPHEGVRPRSGQRVHAPSVARPRYTARIKWCKDQRVTIYNYVQGILREIYGACVQTNGVADIEFTVPKAIHICLETDKNGQVAASEEQSVGHVEFTILLVSRPSAACNN